MSQVGFVQKVKFKVGPYLFVAPYLLLFATFALLPVLLSVVISFLNWDFIEEAEWVGLKNYLLILDPSSLAGETFFNSLKHTLLFVGVQTPILIVLPLLVALFLNTKLKGSKVMRAIIYFPAILSISTVSTIFYVLLDTNIGIFNVLSGESTPWLTEMPWQWISIFLMSTWWGIGGNMIYYTTGLQSIPAELYEAAQIDGANALQRFFNITLPSLKSTFVYVVIMTILSTFNVMGQPMMLTPGEDNTKVVMQFIYETANGGQRYGRACAMSIVMTVIMAVFSIISFRLIVRKGSENER